MLSEFMFHTKSNKERYHTEFSPGPMSFEAAAALDENKHSYGPLENEPMSQSG
jgi:hypothetical protein